MIEWKRIYRDADGLAVVNSWFRSLIFCVCLCSIAWRVFKKTKKKYLLFSLSKWFYNITIQPHNLKENPVEKENNQSRILSFKNRNPNPFLMHNSQISLHKRSLTSIISTQKYFTRNTRNTFVFGARKHETNVT